MAFVSLKTTLFLAAAAAFAVLVVAMVVLAVKALLKYLRSSDSRKESVLVKKDLGERLKAHRLRCNMTQEFVAENLGVTRQSVSKWETGAADPSTSNLLRLAKLYQVSAEELLKNTVL